MLIIAFLFQAFSGPCAVTEIHTDGTAIVECADDSIDATATVTSVPQGTDTGCMVDFRTFAITSCDSANTYGREMPVDRYPGYSDDNDDPDMYLRDR